MKTANRFCEHNAESEWRKPIDSHKKLMGPEVSIEKDQLLIPDFEIDTLARCLLPKIRAYFDSPEGQAAFEEWQQQQNT